MLGFYSVLALGVVLLGMLFSAFYYSSHFFKNSTINGVDVKKMTAESAQKALGDDIASQEITINAREGSYSFPCKQIAYECVPGDSIKALLSGQKPFRFSSENKKSHTYVLDIPAKYDASLLRTTIKSLPFANESTMRMPTDAYIEQMGDEGYVLVPEDNGTVLIFDKALSQISSAIDAGQKEVTLTDDCYENAEITTQDPELQRIMQAVTAYYDTTITYTIGDATEVVDSATVRKWLSLDDDFNVTIDEDKVTKFVQYLASTYNTYSDERQFKTSMGDTVTIGGGDYGWVVNKKAEREQLMNDLNTGGTIERTPVFEQTAKDFWPNDIGDSYVEVDYTNQHMWYYKEGHLMLDSDIVSGCLNRGTGSPDGVYKVVYKTTNATLVGEDYSSDVAYFMPFAYNVGFHDASWRNTFGEEIYRTSGSHGCINMPTDKAKELYEVLEVGTPVVAFYREPVIISTNNAGKSNAYSYVKPEEQPEAATTEIGEQ